MVAEVASVCALAGLAAVPVRPAVGMIPLVGASFINEGGVWLAPAFDVSAGVAEVCPCDGMRW
jgi:hypothetical protein